MSEAAWDLWPATAYGISTGRDGFSSTSPIAAAVRLASRLPNAQAHLFDGEGHFVFHAHGDAVVASIREHAST